MTLVACESFLMDLRRSNLIERGQLEQIVSDFARESPLAEPAQFAKYLVDQGFLTPFQAERILDGKPLDMVLGPYVLLDALGTGSMGTVYAAMNKNDNSGYAVKVLPRRSLLKVIAARRLVRAYEKCKHPAVVPFCDVGTAGSANYLVWPLVEGTPLDKVVQEKGRLSPARTARYMQQVAAGLSVCHRQNLIHGFVKPSNLLITANDQVLILDFGIGSLLVASEGESMVDTMSMANAQASGLDCVSPESIIDPTNLTPAGDQYSLGCVMYYCLTGQYPFPGETAVEKMVGHQSKQPIPVRELAPNVPEEMEAIINRLMQKTPEKRFASMEQVIPALDRLAATAPDYVETPASSVASPTPSQPSTQRAIPTRESLFGASPAAPTPAQSDGGAGDAATEAPPAVPPRPAPPPRSPSAPRQAPTPPRPQPQAAPRPPAAPAKRPAASSTQRPNPPAALDDNVASDKQVPVADPSRERVAALRPRSAPSQRTKPSASAIDFKVLRCLINASVHAKGMTFKRRLGGLILSLWNTLKKRDRVHTSVVGSPHATAGDIAFIHAVSFRLDHAFLARKVAKAFRVPFVSAASHDLETNFQFGDRISFHLSAPGLKIEQSHAEFIWQGKPEAATFRVSVPADHAPGTVVGTVTVHQNHRPLGRIDFALEIVSEKVPTLEPVPLALGAQCYR
ncbi:MAG: hypothetical protein KatS3mg105_2530 [Gemmatales bacterium]|nr:MAG: hypothetical protein KatS3mg105_2530 [Gemmatales bacterium]